MRVKITLRGNQCRSPGLPFSSSRQLYSPHTRKQNKMVFYTTAEDSLTWLRPIPLSRRWTPKLHLEQEHPHDSQVAVTECWGRLSCTFSENDCLSPSGCCFLTHGTIITSNLSEIQGSNHWQFSVLSKPNHIKVNYTLPEFQL